MLTTLATRLALAITGSLLATGVLAGPALANSELDQSATFKGDGSNINVQGNQTVAQIFTPGISGELSAVNLGVKKEYDVTELRVEITEATGGVPSGSALATEILTGSALNVVTTGQQVFTVNFSDPASVSEGSAYAIVVSSPDERTSPTTGGYFKWYYSVAYPDGNAALNVGAWSVDSGDLTFATYVTVPSPSSTGSANQPARTITLALTLPAGVQCSSSSLTTSGPWIQLPSAGDCSVSGRASDTNPLLLGWATQKDFPVEIAQRQVDNGWGAYETFTGERQLTGVFIPAGGYTAVTGDTNLYPIWSE